MIPDDEGMAHPLPSIEELVMAVEFVLARLDDATEAGKGITDERLRAALYGGEKGTFCIVPAEAWFALSNALERTRSLLTGKPATLTALVKA